MDHDVFLAFEKLNGKVDKIIAAQAVLTHLENLSMAKIDDLEAEVTKVGNVQDSAIALINGIAQQLRDAATNDPRIQAVIDGLDAKATALASAISANTPAGPAPTV